MNAREQRAIPSDMERPPWVRERLPRVLPAGWSRFNYSPGWWFLKLGVDGSELRVCVSGFEHDGKRWVHVSMSRTQRLPSYDDMCECKQLFIGAGREAVQAFTVADEHVNFHPNCLHLWSWADGSLLPDFRVLGLL